MKCYVAMEEIEVNVEAREVIEQRGNRELEKALEFAGKEDRKAMALGCARTAAMIFLQLGEGFEDRLLEARGVVGKLEAEVAEKRAKAFEKELRAVRDAAVRAGLGSAEEVEAEKLGRLQEGLWIELQKHAELPLWDKVGEKGRRHLDEAMALVAAGMVQKAKAVDGVRAATVGETWKVFGSDTARWVVKITIEAEWGRRSFMVRF